MSFGSSSSLLALYFSFFLLFYPVSSFNITKILSSYSDFGNFNDMLSRTKVADAVNSRQTITVLAVDSGSLGPLTGLSADVQKKVLSLHVILDYYDIAKLQSLPKKTAILTTLFQSTGPARGREGFLNVTIIDNAIVFGSAVPGSGLNANLVKSVASQPYKISVLQVGSVIMPSAITNSPPAPNAKSPSKAPAPSKSKSPSSAPAPDDADSSPSESPKAADTPSNSPTPAADSPVTSPPAADGPNVAEGPTADEPASDTPKGDAPDANVGTGITLAVLGMVLPLAWGLAN